MFINYGKCACMCYEHVCINYWFLGDYDLLCYYIYKLFPEHMKLLG
jgi:hypothetical protein